MVNDWEQRVSQLGLTKTTHEYAVYQLLATAIGWSMWKNFLPDQFANPKLLLTRAVRLLRAATIHPAHARPPHPTWIMAVQQVVRCYHPQGKILLLQASLLHNHPGGCNNVNVRTFLILAFVIFCAVVSRGFRVGWVWGGWGAPTHGGGGEHSTCRATTYSSLLLTTTHYYTTPPPTHRGGARSGTSIEGREHSTCSTKY